MLFLNVVQVSAQNVVSNIVPKSQHNQCLGALFAARVGANASQTSAGEFYDELVTCKEADVALKNAHQDLEKKYADLSKWVTDYFGHEESQIGSKRQN